MLRPLLKLSYVDDQESFPLTCLTGIGSQGAGGLLRKEGVRVRVINVVGVPVLIIRADFALRCRFHGVRRVWLTSSRTQQGKLRGFDTPVVINFHGYPAHVKALLFERNQSITRKRFEVLRYVCDELIRCVEVMVANFTCSDRRGYNHHTLVNASLEPR